MMMVTMVMAPSYIPNLIHIKLTTVLVIRSDWLLLCITTVQVKFFKIQLHIVIIALCSYETFVLRQLIH